MMVKICGIKYQDNLDQLSQLKIHMVGYNFYQPSKRYVSEPLQLNGTKSHLSKVGVFVNEDSETITEKIEKYDLDFVQLHGGESVEYCKHIQKLVPVIKVFSIAKASDLKASEKYEICEYFLFDTKTKSHGGSGRKFDWEVLQEYRGLTPFLLAGGIGPDDVEEILKINHPMFVGIDINSKFEIAPGRKDIEVVEGFINRLHADNTSANNQQ